MSTPARLPRVTIKRRGGGDYVTSVLGGTLPEHTDLTMGDASERWLRDRLILLIPGPEGAHENEGIIFVPLAAAREAKDALVSLVQDGLVSAALKPGSIRVELSLPRLKALLLWARAMEATRRTRQKRSEAVRKRHEELSDNRPRLAVLVANEAERNAVDLARWLEPVPERVEQLGLFGRTPPAYDGSGEGGQGL